jgi:hypothetical protein
MNKHLSRRALLKGALTGAVILGFDPVSHSWVTETCAHAISLPPLDGVFLTDPDSRAVVADDFGHILHRQPRAVLRPGSTADVQRMIGFARQHGLTISARGLNMHLPAARKRAPAPGRSYNSPGGESPAFSYWCGERSSSGLATDA